MQVQDADGEKRRCQGVKTRASKLCRRGRETREYDFEGRSDSDDHSAGEGARWINDAERRIKQSEKGWTVSTVSVETSFRRVNWPNQAILRRSICVQTRTIQMRVIKVDVCTLRAKTRASQVCSRGR
jgi:hypothetical protein